MTTPSSDDPQRPPIGPGSGAQPPQPPRDLYTMIFAQPATPPELQGVEQLVNTLELVDVELGRLKARAKSLKRKAARANVRRCELEAERPALVQRAVLAEQRAEAAERARDTARRDAQEQARVLAGNLAALAGERNDLQDRLARLRAAGVDTTPPRATGGPIKNQRPYLVGEPQGHTIRTSNDTPRWEVDATGFRKIPAPGPSAPAHEPWPFRPGDIVRDVEGAETEWLLAAPEGTKVADAAGYEWTRAGLPGLWHMGKGVRSTSAGLADLGPLIVVSVGRQPQTIEERIAAHGHRLGEQLTRIFGVPVQLLHP